MSGLNPYIQQPEFTLPQKNYRITFLPEGKTVEVVPGELRIQGDGLPGSILRTALDAGLDLDHSCGGVCACSTCHVIVREGFDSLAESTEDEDDMLDKAWGLEPESRLGCQARVTDSDLVVEIPKYTINMVSENH